MKNQNESFGWPEGMSPPITEAILNGICEGLAAFVKKNKLSTDIGAKHVNPLHEFVLRFTAEMQDGDDPKVLYKRVYPFKNSFRAAWEQALAERNPVLIALWNNKEHKEAIALARTLAYLEVLKFLEENRLELIAEYHAIRGGDFVIEEITSKNLLQE